MTQESFEMIDTGNVRQFTHGYLPRKDGLPVGSQYRRGVK